MSAGDPLKAVRIIADFLEQEKGAGSGERGSSKGGKKWQDQVMEIVRSANKGEKELLEECGKVS